MKIVWVMAAVTSLVGCSVDDGKSNSYTHSDPSLDRPEATYRGPGQWRPALDTVASPVDVSLVTTGLWKDNRVMPNGTGDHLAFALGDAACEVDSTTGTMDTDVAVEGDSVEINDVSVDNTILVVSDAGISLVDPSGDGFMFGGSASLAIAGEFSAARFVGDSIVAMDNLCRIVWDDGSMVALDGETCGTFEATTDGTYLLFATSEGVRRIGRGTNQIIDTHPADLIAFDGLTGSIITSDGPVVRGETWERRLGEEGRNLTIHHLAASDDLGIVVAGVTSGSDSRIEILDSASGEPLGTLEIRDGTTLAGVSKTGGLLLQERAGDTVSWHLSR